MGSYIILFIIFIEIIGLLIFIFIGYKHLQIIIKNKININSENKKFDKLITQGNKKQINKKKINSNENKIKKGKIKKSSKKNKLINNIQFTCR